MWSSSVGDYGMTSMEAGPAPRDWTACSDPPAESCSDAGCPVHGGEEPIWEPDGLGLDDDEA